MQTIILAGGEGKRLRPVTCTMPKPLVPLLNKPTLFYALEHLHRQGFDDITINLGYLSDEIKKAVGDGTAFGQRIRFCLPARSLGTAGSVRYAVGEKASQTVLVFSGDALTDFDLSAAYKAHKESCAEVTVLLYRVAKPGEYGIALTDERGFIKGFAEKPSRTQVFSDYANTGIYFIEPGALNDLPKDTDLDFSKDVFPKLLENGVKLFGLRMKGYWSDIGNVSELCRTQRDMLQKLVSFSTKAVEHDGVFIEPDAIVSPKARLSAPCYIGSGAQIGAYACVEPFSVICSGAKLEEDCSVARSVIMHGAALRSGAEVRGALICENAEVASDAAVFEGAVIGAGSLVQSRATVCPNVLIWPEKTVEQGEKCRANIVWGTGRGLSACGSCFSGSGDSYITPQRAVSIAAAYASRLRLPSELLIGCDGKPASVMLKHALAAGAVSQGVEALAAEYGSRYAFASLLRHMGAAGGLYASSSANDCEVCIRLYDSRGIEAEAADVRSVENALRSGEQRPVTSAELGAIRFVGGGDMCLAADIGRSVQSRILAASPKRLALNASEEICRDAAAYLLRYGWHADCRYDRKKLLPVFGDNVISILCDENERVAAYVAPDTVIDYHMLLAAVALDLQLKTAVVPLDLDTGLEEYLNSAGVSCRPAPDSAEARRRAAANSGLYVSALLEPVMTIVKVCELFAKGTLKESVEAMPACKRRTAEYKVAGEDAARMLRRLAEGGGDRVSDIAEGIKLKHDTGWVTVKPCPERSSFRVVAGSSDAEYSKELCDLYIDKLRSLKHKPED